MVWWGVQQAGEERDGPCGECSRRGAGRVMRERRREHSGAAVRPVWTVVIEGGGGISDGDRREEIAAGVVVAKNCCRYRWDEGILQDGIDPRNGRCVRSVAEREQKPRGGEFHRKHKIHMKKAVKK